MSHLFDAPLGVALEVTGVQQVREDCRLGVNFGLLGARKGPHQHRRIVVEKPLVQLGDNRVDDLRHSEPLNVGFKDVRVLVRCHRSRRLVQQIAIAPQQVPLLIRNELLGCYCTTVDQRDFSANACERPVLLVVLRVQGTIWIAVNG